MDRKLIAKELVKVAKSLVAIDKVSLVVEKHIDMVIIAIKSYRDWRYFDLREVEGWDASLEKLYDQVRDTIAAAGFDSSPGRVPAAFDMKTQTGYVTMRTWKKGIGIANVEEVVNVLKQSPLKRYL